MLSTRIVQRRALRVVGPAGASELPIRKFALQLVVEPVSGIGPAGQSTVTAFLHPHAQLAEVWTRAEPIDSGPLQGKERNHLAARVPSGSGRLAIARVTYTGIPSGVGLCKDTMVLLTSGAYEPEDTVSVM